VLQGGALVSDRQFGMKGAPSFALKRPACRHFGKSFNPYSRTDTQPPPNTPASTSHWIVTPRPSLQC